MTTMINLFLLINFTDIASAIAQTLTSPATIPSTAATIATVSTFDWTFIISTIVIVIGLVTAVIQLYGPSLSVKDEILRKSEYLNEFKKGIEDKLKDMDELYDEKTEATSEFLIEKIESLSNILEEKIKNINASTTKHENKIDEIKNDIIKIKESLAELKHSCDTNTKSAENIRLEQRKLIERIDNVLRQILDLID